MANTYTQLYVQIVFTVKGRKHMIHKKYKDDLEKYITSIIQLDRTKLIQIYCMPDHIHILIGLHPSESISQIVQNVKVSSTKFLKKQNVIFRYVTRLMLHIPDSTIHTLRELMEPVAK